MERELADVVARGADIPRLRELAMQGKQAELQRELADLGIAKLGAKLRVQKALVEADASAIARAAASAATAATTAASNKALVDAPAQPPLPPSPPPLPAPATAVEAEAASPSEDKKRQPANPADLISQLAGKLGGQVLRPGEFQTGARVRLKDLKAKPELNGVEAEVIGPSTDGRHPVRLVQTGKTLKVRVENLDAIGGSTAGSAPGSPGGAGGTGATGGLSKEERDRFPLPWSIDGNLRHLEDPSVSDAAKLEVFKVGSARPAPKPRAARPRAACPLRSATRAVGVRAQVLADHCASQDPAHHEKLTKAGYASTMVMLMNSDGMLAERCARDPSGRGGGGGRGAGGGGKENQTFSKVL